ncbi:MAG: hydantoinase B/oxoprolinase family protein [Armatimonadota bacterium]|nr:hydantoinase B/oxoprolinase family protein [Armatimonadota bacterium]
MAIEVQWSRLIAIMDEVDVALVRTSFSTIVGESRDFAVIMLDRHGRSICQSQLSSPAFTCHLPITTKHLLKSFPQETLAPGDVLITNDPWIGTGHLPDLSIIMPVFDSGTLVAFLACAAHVADIGGRLDFFEARDVFEEGLRIPPSKLFAAGRENEQLFRLIAANVRVPDMVVGDIHAIVGAERLGAERLRDFLADYGGPPAFQRLADEILRRSERAMRTALRTLPDGEWSFALEADGFRRPLRIQVMVRKQDDRVHVDYTGSSPQFGDASINCVNNCTFADSFYPLKCSLVPALPNNEGLFQALTISAPEGSVLNTTFPSPVKSRSKTSFHIHMAIYGALAETMPDRVQAGSGSFWAITFHGMHEDGSTFNVHVLPNGGKGATARADGLPTIAFPYNGTVTPVEIVENQAPLLVEYKRLVPDSGGAGRYRGGLGQEIQFLVKRRLIASIRPDKIRFPPPGIRGGRPGLAGHFTVNGHEVPVEPHTLHPGDRIYMRLPGGGGYGNPADRDPELVVRDVLEGYVSPTAARREYGLNVRVGKNRGRSDRVRVPARERTKKRRRAP